MPMSSLFSCGLSSESPRCGVGVSPSAPGRKLYLYRKRASSSPCLSSCSYSVGSESQPQNPAKLHGSARPSPVQDLSNGPGKSSGGDNNVDREYRLVLSYVCKIGYCHLVVPVQQRQLSGWVPDLAAPTWRYKPHLESLHTQSEPAFFYWTGTKWLRTTKGSASMMLRQPSDGAVKSWLQSSSSHHQLPLSSNLSTSLGGKSAASPGRPLETARPDAWRRSRAANVSDPLPVRNTDASLVDDAVALIQSTIPAKQQTTSSDVRNASEDTGSNAMANGPVEVGSGDSNERLMCLPSVPGGTESGQLSKGRCKKRVRFVDD
ncbi:MAG: hypothetical protein M1837_006685 [Sclerophora amabilis]|nr:MAG: hypothetical protein M1837_006685 [Sclerophora amabilis]